jgi:hypothetical protein
VNEPVLYDAVKLLILEVNELKEEVVTKPLVSTGPPPPEPVFTVIGKVDPSPLVNVIVFKITEAVVKAFGVYDAVVAKLALTA